MAKVNINQKKEKKTKGEGGEKALEATNVPFWLYRLYAALRRMNK
jgi:hypothetical protein